MNNLMSSLMESAMHGANDVFTVQKFRFSGQIVDSISFKEKDVALEFASDVVKSMPSSKYFVEVHEVTDEGGSNTLWSSEAKDPDKKTKKPGKVPTKTDAEGDGSITNIKAGNEAKSGDKKEKKPGKVPVKTDAKDDTGSVKNIKAPNEGVLPDHAEPTDKKIQAMVEEEDTEEKCDEESEDDDEENVDEASKKQTLSEFTEYIKSIYGFEEGESEEDFDEAVYVAMKELHGDEIYDALLDAFTAGKNTNG